MATMTRNAVFNPLAVAASMDTLMRPLRDIERMNALLRPLRTLESLNALHRPLGASAGFSAAHGPFGVRSTEALLRPVRVAESLKVLDRLVGAERGLDALLRVGTVENMVGIRPLEQSLIASQLDFRSVFQDTRSARLATASLAIPSRRYRVWSESVVADLPADAADAALDLSEQVDSRPRVVLTWLRGLAPDALPTVSAPALSLLAALGGLVDAQLGVEPSPEARSLMAVVIAVVGYVEWRERRS
jgi:hypothetical protein